MKHGRRILSSHLPTNKRPSRKGSMPTNSTFLCMGRIFVHCPLGNAVQGSVRHSIEPFLSPPAKTNFPETKTAPCSYRGVKSGAREIHPDSMGLLEFHGQCSISTVSEGLPMVVSPPIANIRPSVSQFTVSRIRATFIDSCHLEYRKRM